MLEVCPKEGSLYPLTPLTSSRVLQVDSSKPSPPPPLESKVVQSSLDVRAIYHSGIRPGFPMNETWKVSEGNSR